MSYLADKLRRISSLCVFRKEEANFVGMIIPEIHWGSYVKDNLQAYNSVCLRKSRPRLCLESLTKLSEEEAIKYLSQLKDLEIFETLGAMVGYRSRNQLVRLSTRALTNKKFFLVNNQSSFCNSTSNSITYSANNFIGYGTVTDYSRYSFDEICVNKFTKEEQQELLFFLETYFPC